MSNSSDIKIELRITAKQLRHDLFVFAIHLPEPERELLRALDRIATLHGSVTIRPRMTRNDAFVMARVMRHQGRSDHTRNGTTSVDGTGQQPNGTQRIYKLARQVESQLKEAGYENEVERHRS